MKTIYIDSEFHCHLTNDGTMTVIETDYFDDKCDTFIEGYCFEPVDEFVHKIYPWKDYNELEEAQWLYEQEKLMECEQALAVMGVVFE